MGFYQDIRNSFGFETMKKMKQWSSSNIKLANQLNRKHFLLRCRRNRIAPFHIEDSITKTRTLLTTTHWRISQEINNFTDRLGNKIINIEIKICYNTIKKLKDFINNLQSCIESILPPHIFNDFSNRLQISFNRRFNKVKSANIAKYNNLFNNDNIADKLFVDNSKWYLNISNVDIPKDIADFLSLGPKFGVPVVGNQINVKRFLADVESVVESVPEDDRNLLRARVANNVTNFLNHPQTNSLPYLSKMYLKTKKFLKQHPDLLIVKADKGGCTVAMNINDYNVKTEELLSDTSTYQRLSKDPTYGLQRRYNQLIKQLKSDKELTEHVAKHLMNYNSVPAKLYGLPKIHKQNIPLRPIVSSIKSLTYNLSKFLSDILTAAFADITSYNVVDTFTFVNSVRGLTLPDNYVLISLDVVSLFTNIPMDLVFDILERGWSLLEPHTTITKANFFKLLKFVCSNCYFSFKNTFYLQIFGTPMGSPISPILALIVMDSLFDDVIPKLPFQLPFIYKYVDDVICAVPLDSVDTTLNIFNSYDPHVQFTVENEKDNKVPFLDTELIRCENNSIILNWYQKPTSSGRYINYYSSHPNSHKFNTVIAMKNRVTHISDEKFLRDNLNRLVLMFSNNGYPKHILNKLIYNSNFFDGPVDNVVVDPFTYKKIPFVKGLTENIVSQFKSYNNLKIAKYNTFTVAGVFSRIKDRTHIMDQSDVIYSVPCRDCQGCYVGQTSQLLKNRITQHRSDSRIGKNSCALALHFKNSDHNFDFNNVKILDQETNYKKRLFLEMAHIFTDKQSINFKTDINQLSNIYCNILNFNR